MADGSHHVRHLKAALGLGTADLLGGVADDQLAFPITRNVPLGDSITQANTKVLGAAPAIAMGDFFQATATALANAMHNSTMAQQQSNITAQAATTMGVTTFLTIDTSRDATGVAIPGSLRF